MLTCSKCRQEKPENEFTRDKSTRTGFCWWCKACNATRAKDTTTPEYAARKRASAARYQTNKRLLDVWKSERGCCMCPEREPVCLDLHHVDPCQKEMNVSSVIARRTWDRVLVEINKCVVVCSNCHRKLHAGIVTLIE